MTYGYTPRTPAEDAALIQELTRQRQAMLGQAPPMGAGLHFSSGPPAMVGPPLAGVYDGAGAPPPMGPGYNTMRGAPPMGLGLGDVGILSSALQSGQDAPDAPVPVERPAFHSSLGRFHPSTAPKRPVAQQMPPVDDGGRVDPLPGQGDPQQAQAQAPAQQPDPTGGTTGGPRQLFSADLPPPPHPALADAVQGMGSQGGNEHAPGFWDKFQSSGAVDMMGALGAGLLSGKNFRQGLAQGVMMALQQKHQKKQDDREDKKVDASISQANRGLDLQQRGQDQAQDRFGQGMAFDREKMGVQQDQFGQTIGLDRDRMTQQGDQFGQQLGVERERMAQQGAQFGQELGVRKDDLAMRRQEQGALDRSRAAQLALSEKELQERIDNNAENRALDKARLAQGLEIAKMGTAAHGMMTGPNGEAIPYRETKDGRMQTMQPGAKDWQDGVPDGASSGISAVTPRLKDDEAGYQSLMTSAASAPDRIDQLQSIQKEVTANPQAFGPAIQQKFVRGVSTLLGLDPSASIQQVQQAARAGELDQAISKMSKQGQITEGERAILRQSLIDPESMNADVIKKLAPKLIARAQEDMTLAGKAKDRPKDKRFGEWEMEERMALRNQNGGPMSGEKPPGVQLSPEDNALVNKYLK